MIEIPEHLIRNLQNPNIDVSESEAALSEFVRERMAKAWIEGTEAKPDNIYGEVFPATNPYED